MISNFSLHSSPFFGRATIMMPHPERLFRAIQMSYRPDDQFTGEAGPWLKMFQNARNYVS